MARMTLILVCLVLTVLPAQVWGQEAYSIKLRPGGDGETTRYDDTLTTEMTTRQVDATGLEVGKRSDHSVRQAVYEETVLERDPASGQVNRLRRRCDRATIEVNKKASELPFHGKTFTVERGPEGCRVRFEGVSPPEEFVHELQEGFRQKKDVNLLDGMLPGRAVKVGETWTFDPRPLLQAWPKPAQVRFDEVKLTATGKLTRAYPRDGRVFGVLEFAVEVPVSGVDFDARGAALEPGARLAVSLTVDACIDGGSSTFALKMEDDLRVRVRLPAPSGQRITGTLSERHVRTETRP